MKMNRRFDYHFKQGKKSTIRDRIRMILFMVILLALCIIGLILPLRPKESLIEKRKLAEFPKPTVSGIWDGSWFSELTTWYADSYPLREVLISIQTQTEALYGIRETAIYGDTTKQGDHIPEAENSRPIAAPVIDEIEDEESDEEELKPSVNSKGKDSEVEINQKKPDNTVEEEENAGEEGAVKVQPEVAGTIYVAENRGFSLYYFYQKGADTYASMLNTVAKKIDGSATMYDIVVPNSYGVNLDEEIQEKMKTSNQGKAIDYIYSRLDPSIKTVETYHTLRKHNSEYLYFNTDHHWTALGAYYVYRQWCEEKGITPHELSEFEQKEFPGFVGTFYAYSNQSPALASNPDTVVAYVPMATNTQTIHPPTGGTYEFPIISDASKMSKGNKYLTFIGGDQPLIEIKNPNITDGSSCIIIKESYGNAFVPFLVDHYENVYVVDYRHYKGNVVELAKKNKNTDLIFLNNTEAVGTKKSKQMLSIFK